MSKFVWETYPEHQTRSTGCKVSWLYYDNREDADVASAAAKHNAERQLQLGYDFGYCRPGSVDWVGPDHNCGGENGRWAVCLP
jgi:hypothetical protein